ncbi:SNF2 family N-terminal domain-containing protein [Aspergillus unguis]
MGLGKTLSLLSLVCFSLDNLDESSFPDNHPRATLIIAPKSTIPAWEHQIKTHIRSGQVRYLVYHGTKREGAKQPFNRHYDIVITTYETLHHDSKADNKLRGEKWYRVVLDEAHRIRTRASAQFKAAAELNAYYRWCLTGTPIQDSLDDYGALLAFLQVETFREKRLFDYWIAGPMKRKGAGGVSNLKLLVAATCLRRTKKNIMVEEAVELPDKKEVIEPIQLAAAEREIYEFFQRKASKLLTQLGPPEQCERKDNNTLSVINNMRLICNHGEDLLPESQVAIWHEHKKGRRKETTSSAPDGGEGLSSQYPRGINYNCNRGSKKPSTKVQALLKNLDTEQRASGGVSPKPVKSVVFSQWTKMLDLVGDALRGCNYEFARIDGGLSLPCRSDALQRFNENDNCTVMLASTRSAAEGIDMTAASFVHILEPHWNPKLEDQAIGRVHRIGQSRNVLVTRYLVENSIEDYVRWLQDDKNWITQVSLTGADVELSSLDLDCQRREKLQQVFTLA